jgi:hypothetical protein
VYVCPVPCLVLRRARRDVLAIAVRFISFGWSYGQPPQADVAVIHSDVGGGSSCPRAGGPGDRDRHGAGFVTAVVIAGLALKTRKGRSMRAFYFCLAVTGWALLLALIAVLANVHH